MKILFPVDFTQIGGELWGSSHCSLFSANLEWIILFSCLSNKVYFEQPCFHVIVLMFVLQCLLRTALFKAVFMSLFSCLSCNVYFEQPCFHVIVLMFVLQCLLRTALFSCHCSHVCLAMFTSNSPVFMSLFSCLSCNVYFEQPCFHVIVLMFVLQCLLQRPS